MISDITLEELQSATRNHGMPLEGLQYDVTPIGMHYVLIHFDIPHVEETAWRLRIDGRVSQTLSLSLDDIKSDIAQQLADTCNRGIMRFI
jgi:DMSO/TMAO reductase YedYZ molybdopterin-dependent catalytic subunit